MANRFKVETIFKAVDRLSRPIVKMERSTERFLRTTQRQAKKANVSINGLIKTIRNAGSFAFKGLTIAAGALVTTIGLLVRQFSKIEDARASFTPLLGGAEAARKAVDALNKTAATTPFQFETLARSARQLLPVLNGDIEEMVSTVRMLGDTAGGNADRMNRITLGFSKAMLKQRVDMESLNIIAEAGVPIFTELADTIGVKVNKSFFKLISSGKITTKQLTETFRRMTSEGGKFFNGMQIASQTTSGLYSTLKDNISLTAATIGEILAPTVKDFLKSATALARRIRDWVEANKDLIQQRFDKFVKRLKSGFDSFLNSLRKLNKEYKLEDLILKTLEAGGKFILYLAENGKMLKKVALTVGVVIVALKALALIMTIVAAVSLATPMGLVVAAVVGVIAAVTALVVWWDDLNAAFDRAPRWLKVVGLALAALTGPIGLVAAGAITIMKQWEPIKEFFQGIIDKVDALFTKISNFKLPEINIPGLSGDEEERDQRVKTIQENRKKRLQQLRGGSRPSQTTETINRAEIKITDDTGRAQVVEGDLGDNITLVQSGVFS